MQGTPIELVPPRHPRVLALGALALAAVGFWLHAAGKGGAPLDLDPYLPKNLAPGPLGGVLLALQERSSWWLGVLVVLVAGGLFLLGEGLIRHLWRKPNASAALLAAVLFLVLPAHECFYRVRGAASLLAGLALVLPALSLTLSRRRGLLFLGTVLVALAPLLHPLLLVFTPLPLLTLKLAGHSRGRGPSLRLLGSLLLVGIAAFLAGENFWPPAPTRALVTRGPFPAAAYVGVRGRRLELGWKSLLSLPVELPKREARALFPTGHALLSGQVPVALGLYTWLLLLAFGGLVAGLSRGFWALLFVALAVLGGPFLIPGWIPGDKAHLLSAAWPLLVWLGVVLGAFRGPIARPALLGIACGLVLVAVLQEPALSRSLWRRPAALQLPERLPGQGLGGLGLLAPEAEPDPARLVLFLTAVGLGDPYGPALEKAALARLKAKAQALCPAILKDLLKLPLPRDATRPKEERDLLGRLMGVWHRLERLQQRQASVPWDQILALQLQEADELIPEVLEFKESLPTHPRVVVLALRFKNLLHDLVLTCSRVGWLKRSLPLIEALTDLDPVQARWQARLGISLEQMGKHRQALSPLKKALAALDARRVLALFSRGYLGRARAALGQKKQGLADLRQACTGLGSRVFGSLRPWHPDRLEYWQMAELLLARFELVKELYPQSLTRAHRELTGVLTPALDFGRRKVPALVFQARLDLLEGRREEALARLQQLRQLHAEGLREQGGGSQGRFDHVRFRRRGLKLLLRLLDDVRDAAQVSSIRAELDALRP